MFVSPLRYTPATHRPTRYRGHGGSGATTNNISNMETIKQSAAELLAPMAHRLSQIAGITCGLTHMGAGTFSLWVEDMDARQQLNKVRSYMIIGNDEMPRPAPAEYDADTDMSVLYFTLPSHE